MTNNVLYLYICILLDQVINPPKLKFSQTVLSYVLINTNGSVLFVCCTFIYCSVLKDGLT